MKLILASQSPQRRTLLSELGVEFEVIPSEVDEEAYEESNPEERARVLSRLKAQDVHSRNNDAYVLGSDTLVVASDGTLLEKPVDADDARRMLRLHSGRTSLVHSGVCLVSPDGSVQDDLSTSEISFRELSDEDIEWWISKELWKERSGSFQIEGKGELLLDSFKGSWSGVVGLPVGIVRRMLKSVS